MLPFPELGTMPSTAGSILAAPEVTEPGGGFAGTLQAMFEQACMDEGAQAGAVAVGDLSLRERSADAWKPVLPATAEAGPAEGGEQRVVVESPVVGLWARLERVESVSLEIASEGQEAAQGEQKDVPRHDESTEPLAAGRVPGAILRPEARGTEAGTDQEQSGAPLREAVGLERSLDINSGRVVMGQRVELHPPVPQDQLPDQEPHSPENLQEPGSQKEAWPKFRPAALQNQLPVGEPQSPAGLKEPGSPKQASLEIERNSSWNAGRPVAPDSESGLAMAAVRRNAGDVEVRPVLGEGVTEATQDPLELRGRTEQPTRPPAGLVELKRQQNLGLRSKERNRGGSGGLQPEGRDAG
jgi:hypothetical protein